MFDPYALQEGNNALSQGLSIFSTIKSNKNKQRQSAQQAALLDRQDKINKARAYGEMVKDFGSATANQAAAQFGLLDGQQEQGTAVGPDPMISALKSRQTNYTGPQ